MPSVTIELTIDHGLFEWIRAYHEVLAFHDTVEEQMVYMLRKGITDYSPNDGIGEPMFALMRKRWPGGVNTEENIERWLATRVENYCWVDPVC